MTDDVTHSSSSQKIDGDFSFQVCATSGDARTGVLKTPHGDVPTPIFMPVGTVGSVKGLGPDDLENANAHIVLGNTYHLMLRPGPERLERLGGLHKFMRWDRPLLTDSGGFQVFSLASGNPRGESKKRGSGGPLVKLDEDGVTFRSHLDGHSIRMTPEESMRIQMCINPDIIMAFDQCPDARSTEKEVQVAMDRTSRWLRRCVESMTDKRSHLFGIIQGGVYPHLRRQHAKDICSTDLFGYAIGGLSVGETKEDMMRALEATTPFMPAKKPRYLMGVGTPDDLLDGVARGVDMFDCVMPTRNARNATLFTSKGKLTIKNARFAEDERPVDENCACYCCTNFTRAYMRHLFRASELLFFRLASLHNITYYLSLMSDARQAISDDRFASFADERKAAHAAGVDA
ncbi:MAG: tRNA guanosine(34) transglycosylase Tgt [Deltaproteobacteria bacterium]|nr:tRNA guanosine(34) transglycosylase Tgt [Deltaproteobacteria bacterium]